MFQKIFSAPIQFFRQKLIHSVFIKDILYRIYWTFPELIREHNPIRDTLLKFSQKNKKVFFVSIGSNDGISGDPLREFIITKKWSGLMIEPVPHVFKRLRQVYKYVPNIIFENVAISDSAGNKKFWYIQKNNVLKSGYDQIGSFDLNQKNVYSKYLNLWPDLKKYLTYQKLPCLPLKDIFSKNNIQHVDVLMIDTEGFDYQVLKQINFAKIKPKIIIYEHCNLSPSDKTSAANLLTKNGYQVRDCGDQVNNLAVLND